MASKLRTAFTYVGVTAGVLLVAVGSAIRPDVYTAAAGVEYLEGEGFTHVTGGEVNLLGSLCRKNELKREYSALDSKGRKVELHVCFGSMFGPHAPLFESHTP